MLKDLLSEIIQGRILATYLAVFTVSWADLSEVVMIVFYIIGGSYAIWEWYHKYQDRKGKGKRKFKKRI